MFLRFRNQDVVAKEVTRLIHSDPVSFIEIPDAAQVYDMWATQNSWPIILTSFVSRWYICGASESSLLVSQ